MTAMKTMFNLRGRRALVTGSSSGLGRPMALILAEHGAEVMIHGSGNRERAEAAAEEVRSFGVRSAVALVDLTTPDAAERLVSETEAALGPIDILVSNASIQIRETWKECSLESFERQMRANVWTGLELIQLTAPGMMERGWGRVVTVGSVQQDRPNPNLPVYAASKAAQMNLVRNFAREFAPRGVTVNNLAPGTFVTDRNREVFRDVAYRTAIEASIPAGAFGRMEDCAGALLLLCSEAGRYITGVNLPVDGGMGVQ